MLCEDQHNCMGCGECLEEDNVYDSESDFYRLLFEEEESD